MLNEILERFVAERLYYREKFCRSMNLILYILQFKNHKLIYPNRKKKNMNQVSKFLKRFSTVSFFNFNKINKIKKYV